VGTRTWIMPTNNTLTDNSNQGLFYGLKSVCGGEGGASLYKPLFNTKPGKIQTRRTYYLDRNDHKIMLNMKSHVAMNSS